VAGAAGLLDIEPLAARRIAIETLGHPRESVAAGELHPHRHVARDVGDVRQEVGHLAAVDGQDVARQRPGEAIVHAIGQ
jgi:hypothetical protein